MFLNAGYLDIDIDIDIVLILILILKIYQLRNDVPQCRLPWPAGESQEWNQDWLLTPSSAPVFPNCPNHVPVWLTIDFAPVCPNHVPVGLTIDPLLDSMFCPSVHAFAVPMSLT